MTVKKLGIIGGSFDPVHKGHLSSAEFVYRTLNLDKVIFVPAFIAPHKIGLEFAPAADRYRMTELAVQDYHYFDVSDVELKRSGISYTYDTVLELKKQYPGYELFFIVGADSVPQLNTWNHIYELLNEVTFVAVARPGYAKAFARAREYFGGLGEEKIMLLKMPEQPVSSTEIRECIKNGESIDGMVPEAVRDYILEKGLYR